MRIDFTRRMSCNNRAPRRRTPRIAASDSAAMPSEYDSLESIEVNERSTAPTKVLSTYGGVDASAKNYFFHVRSNLLAV